MASKKLLAAVIIYAVLIIGISVIAFCIFGKITIPLVLSMIFIYIPLTALFASIVFISIDKRENIMQNMVFSTVSIVYLIVAIVVNAIVNSMNLEFRFFLAVELTLMLIAAVVYVIIYLAKLHAEK